MSASVLARFTKRFKAGLLRTTNERWIDGVAFVATFIYQVFFGKPSTLWELVEPFVWLICLLCAVHVVVAIREVWTEISREPTAREVELPILLPNGNKSKTVVLEPHPPHFRLKLGGILLGSLMLLSGLSYSVRRAAVASVRTYIYLVPTSQLMECQKRAFFVKIAGPQILSNVEILLRDNKAGKMYSQTYPEIDPGPRSDVYFWVTPSSPWDEDYTATVAARELRSSQRLIVRGTQHQLQFGVEITIDDATKPAVRCRDRLLPDSYTLAAGEHHSCTDIMTLPGDVPSELDVPGYQTADGNFTIRRVKELPAPSALDDLSDDRHLTEYQRQIIEPTFAKYHRSHVVIYFAGGDKSKAYAEEFFRVFRANNWTANPPTMVPVGDERIIDVQMSANAQDNWGKGNPKLYDVLSAFEKAGIKHRSAPTLDPNVPSDQIVLWVGPRSPKDVSPDQCSPPELKPRAGEHHTCEIIAQGTCPFVPQ